MCALLIDVVKNLEITQLFGIETIAALVHENGLLLIASDSFDAYQS